MAEPKQLPSEIAAAIQQRVNRATRGPWAPRFNDMECYVVSEDDLPGEARICENLNQGSDDGESDAIFIAAARTDIQLLLDEREFLLERIERLMSIEELQETVVKLATGGTHPASVEEITESFRKMLSFAYESRETKAAEKLDRIKAVLDPKWSSGGALGAIRAIVEATDE